MLQKKDMFTGLVKSKLVYKSRHNFGLLVSSKCIMFTWKAVKGAAQNNLFTKYDCSFLSNGTEGGT